jgi:hypothetical protein
MTPASTTDDVDKRIDSKSLQRMTPASTTDDVDKRIYSKSVQLIARINELVLSHYNE